MDSSGITSVLVYMRGKLISLARFLLQILCSVHSNDMDSLQITSVCPVI